ncbi:MAG: tRNA (N6-threonylcarbamoyladenosine(37)-N6)-methyltransferase TrmO [Candidatus Bathyarchaeia archaeon]
MKPIGYVKTEALGDEVKDKTHLSRIVIRPELTEALNGIEGFSHVYVVFWLNQISQKQRSIVRVHPRGRLDMPLLGVFATRTNLRPNPIGLTLVRLVKVEGNVLTVQGLDAFDGTPVLDVKPYDFWDMAEDARVPDWWKKLEQERTQRSLSK